MDRPLRRSWYCGFYVVELYNHVRLHSAIGYVTPYTKLTGQEDDVFQERDRKLEAAREQRRLRRNVA